MSIYQTRKDVAELLQGVGWIVYPEPKEMMMPPCLVLVPGSPYVSFNVLDKSRKRLQYQVTLCVANNDNGSALMNLEQFIEDVVALIPSGISISAVTQPTTDTVGSLDLLCADFTLELNTE